MPLFARSDPPDQIHRITYTVIARPDNLTGLSLIVDVPITTEVAVGREMHPGDFIACSEEGDDGGATIREVRDGLPWPKVAVRDGDLVVTVCLPSDVAEQAGRLGVILGGRVYPAR